MGRIVKDEKFYKTLEQYHNNEISVYEASKILNLAISSISAYNKKFYGTKININVKKKTDKEKMLIELADIYYTTTELLELIFKRNRINIIKFYNLIKSGNLPYKRDQFFSMFKNVGTAEHLWTGLFESKRFKW